MNPREDPVFLEWEEAVQRDLVPKLRESALTMNICPDQPDAKYAVELGMSILLDKPIVLVVPDGRQVPRKLAQVADSIVQVDWNDLKTDAGQRLLNEAVEEVLARFPEA